ncbi:zinc finger MYND domain-containing protein 12 [Genypterus blacodes]|uniref:zinc finger MYND domain-containing protein 12 n=1 Tax=Genypterus blacodes TaxID=154954 RepID=UPI003F75969E
MESLSPDSCSPAEILPLALSKGTTKLCELCQNRAHLQCTQCRVTFYCGEEHWQADRAGIHQKICELLASIRSPVQVHFRLAERDMHRAKTLQRQEELLEISQTVARSKMAAGKHGEALPAAQSCLRCAVDIHGPSTVQLVPAYLLLAEANMGLGNVARAQEFLSQAEWTVLNSPECGQEVHHQLHRNLGRLYTATGNLQTALFHFANDIYYASEAYGVESAVTCGGYFLMADVFAKQGNTLVARSLYSEVAHFWHSHLNKLLRIHTENVPNSSQPSVDESQRAELDQMLRTILEFEEDHSGKYPCQVALAAHCLALLWFLGGDSQKAGGFASRALNASQQIPNHELNDSIQGLMQLLETEPHAASD